MHRRFVVVGLILAGLAGCGDPAGPTQPSRALTAVNGATHAAIFPADTLVCTGIGFGGAAAEGTVLVTTAAGLRPAEVVSWRNDLIRARPPTDAASGPVFVIAGGDTLGPLNLLLRTPTAFEPANRPWAGGGGLPRPLWGSAAAAIRYPSAGAIASLVVLFGGVDPTGAMHDTTFIGTVNGSGVVDAWTRAPDSIAPAARHLHAMTGADRVNASLELDGVAYVMGGVDRTGRVLSDVFGIGVTATGAYGFWTPLTPLPGGRAGAATVTAFGTIIVIGGFGPDSLARSSVLSATINPNGTINGWFTGPALPEGRAFAAAVVTGSSLYVLGGQTGLVLPDSADSASVDLRGAVYRIRLSDRSGFFADTAWTELATPLLLPRARHAAFVIGDAIVVTGGVHATAAPTGETEFAVFQEGGSLAPFVESGQTPLVDLGGGPLLDAAAPVTWDAAGREVATLIGGRDGAGTARAAVWWH